MKKAFRVICAPDSLKESLSAIAAADAIAKGAIAAGQTLGRHVEAIRRPISDGGEGFVDALAAALDGELRSTEIHGPLGEPARATWVRVDHALELGEPDVTIEPPFAALETASACGLELVPHDRRDPTKTSTRGVCELILHAVNAGCRTIILGVGGSSTCDGGVGALAALDARFEDESGREITNPTGADLANIARCDLVGAQQALGDVRLIIACDVSNPLLGENGSARVFAPQKGATQPQVESLEIGLTRLADVLRRTGCRFEPDTPGAGASGGLAFGLAAAVGAQLVGGSSLTLQALGMPELLQTADLIISAEGRLDAQSIDGKCCIELARMASDIGPGMIVLAGEVSLRESDIRRLRAVAPGLQWRAIAPVDAEPSVARAQAATFLEAATELIVKEALDGRN